MAHKPRFTTAEQRSLGLGLILLILGSGVRLVLAPGRSDYSWQPSPVAARSSTVGEALRSVSDTLDRVAESSRPLQPGEKIDLNLADAVQFQRLPGVGAQRAAAIVRERTANGPFASEADLERVPGIGRGLVERWEEHLTVAAPGGANPASASGSRPVDLNRAQLNELQQITGIGPALAARIVDARARRGTFGSVEDLLEVPGIGPKTLEIIRKQAVVR